MTLNHRLSGNIIRESLFMSDSHSNFVSYAILDGAACEDLLLKLQKFQPENCCLYSGDLDSGLASVAPYLVRLEVGTHFTTWLVDHIGQNPWGIFCKAASTLPEMRKHFRQFLIVKDPEGKRLYFRFYDPRVLSVFLPACEADHVQELFGPINSYVTTNRQGALVTFTHKGGVIAQKIIVEATLHA